MTGDAAGGSARFARHVLKDGDTLLVADGHGDIDDPSNGLFRDDTRTLSCFRLRIGDAAPVLLGAAVTADNVFFVAHLTNRPFEPPGEAAAPQGLLHLSRTRFLHRERMFERIEVANYGDTPVRVPLRFEVDADFVDMFEVRGSRRAVRGDALPPLPTPSGLRFAYRGLDALLRTSVVAFSEPPAFRAGNVLGFDLQVAPGTRHDLFVDAGPDIGAPPPTREAWRDAAADARRRMRRRLRRGAVTRSNGPLFDEWLARSRSDLALLTTELATGPYPYAGVPWYSTAFGRDAVITALQTLWLDPGLARGVLGFLAAHQATEDSAFRDSAPGKILHETRRGEMTRLHELPFGLYYGGVDTTPLFVLLAGEYAKRTGDAAFVDTLWPSLVAAVGWIERVCDRNADGFLDYARGADSGLSNQGWKDSEDSVFHADGRLAEGPIALVEVQGYVFGALRAVADIAEARGAVGEAARWRERAERLRVAVEARFWMPDAGFYGIAVDGAGALCRVLASNAGHLLFVGLPDADRARVVAQRLLEPDFHGGWGVRTLAHGQPRFNPISYHDGTVWPHDSALCAAGMARAQCRHGAVRLLRAAFESAVHFDFRLPELFCGFPRRSGVPPIAYPVACLPQAWAAGSPFMLLQACLGVSLDAARGLVVVDHPQLPPGIDELRIERLVAGDGELDLQFVRLGDCIGVHPRRRSGRPWGLSLVC